MRMNDKQHTHRININIPHNTQHARKVTGSPKTIDHANSVDSKWHNLTYIDVHSERDTRKTITHEQTITHIEIERRAQLTERKKKNNAVTRAIIIPKKPSHRCDSSDYCYYGFWWVSPKWKNYRNCWRYTSTMGDAIENAHGVRPFTTISAHNPPSRTHTPTYKRTQRASSHDTRLFNSRSQTYGPTYVSIRQLNQRTCKRQSACGRATVKVAIR